MKIRMIMPDERLEDVVDEVDKSQCIACKGLFELPALTLIKVFGIDHLICEECREETE
jgi:hypothetical protein